MTDGLRFDDVCLCNIAVISGIRPSGRRIDYSRLGRKTCGLFYIFSGAACFVDEAGLRTEVTDGGFLFLPKHKRYQMEYTAPATTFVTVNFDAITPTGAEAALFPDLTVLQREDDLKRIATVMMKLEHCSASKNLAATLRKKELIYRLLGMICGDAALAGARQEVGREILAGVRLLEQSYLENLPIERFAAASNMSENLFRKLFVKQLGISPVKYRNRLRIERAKELLAEGGFTVSEVAYASGFENVGYFCRYYRQVVGESPSETKSATARTARWQKGEKL